LRYAPNLQQNARKIAILRYFGLRFWHTENKERQSRRAAALAGGASKKTQEGPAERGALPRAHRSVENLSQLFHLLQQLIKFLGRLDPQAFGARL
jgi:hypothetical protein